jgi:hypothetical protein
MPTFTATIAYNVPVYGTVKVIAETPEHAAEILRADAAEDTYEFWDEVTRAQYDDPSEHRIVSLENEDTSVWLDGLDLYASDRPWDIISEHELAKILEEA